MIGFRKIEKTDKRQSTLTDEGIAMRSVPVYGYTPVMENVDSFERFFHIDEDGNYPEVF